MIQCDQQDCNQDIIQRYLADALSNAEHSSLMTHLDQCAQCRLQLERLAGDANEWDTVRSALQDTSGNDRQPSIYAEDASLVHSSSIASRALELAWVSKWLGATSEPHSMGRIGLFEAMKIVGVGGTGVVFLAKEPALGRDVAIKVLTPQMARSQVARQRFEREARATAGLVHDNIISIYQVSEWRGLPYLVMQYFPEGSLQSYLMEHGRMGIEFAIQVAIQVGQGLAMAHAKGIVHRDIKPANILIANGTQRAVLSDFGLARSDADTALTRTGILAGTPQFMSPEQARGEEVDPRSDLFSLGSLLFTMLAGHPPFHNESEVVAIRRMASGTLPSLRESLPESPQWLVELIGCLLSERKENRPASAETVVAWLQQALSYVRDPKNNQLPRFRSLGSKPKSRFGKSTIYIATATLILFLGGAIFFAWNNLFPSRKPVIVGYDTASVPFKATAPRSLNFSADPVESIYQLSHVTVEFLNDSDQGKSVYTPLVNVIEQGEKNSKPGVFYFTLLVGRQYTVRSTWIVKDNFRVDAPVLELEDKLDCDRFRPSKVTLLPPDAREVTKAQPPVTTAQ